uniref:Ig-like domain-containing protein n=1 Tax=Sinocyclocheilus anshuiensis TaxID=1608454 RepID=A0A671KMG9_9TELE
YCRALVTQNDCVRKTSRLHVSHSECVCVDIICASSPVHIFDLCGSKNDFRRVAASFIFTCEQFTQGIYSYDGEASSIIDERFQDRMEWHGSRNTLDLQDASVDLLNVTFDDSGAYHCIFNRVLGYKHYEFSTIASKVVHLTVVGKGTDESLLRPNVLKGIKISLILLELWACKLWRKNLKSAVSQFLNGHQWHIMQRRQLKSTDFTNRPTNLCVKVTL